MSSEHGTGGHAGSSEGKDAPQMSLFKGETMIGRDRPCPGRCVRRDYDGHVAQTTNVEIDTALLERLRERRPGKSDRELLESMALIALGRKTLRRVQSETCSRSRRR